MITRTPQPHLSRRTERASSLSWLGVLLAVSSSAVMIGLTVLLIVWLVGRSG